jgi:hypothetical protein
VKSEIWIAEALLRAIVALVRRTGADLSARQIGVFLICYLEDEAQTVRGLAASLNISRTAICRALNRLSEFDWSDRRSVLVQRTTMRAGFLRDLQRRSVALGGVPLAAPDREDRRHRQASRYPAVLAPALLSDWTSCRAEAGNSLAGELTTIKNESVR